MFNMDLPLKWASSYYTLLTDIPILLTDLYIFCHLTNRVVGLGIYSRNNTNRDV